MRPGAARQISRRAGSGRHQAGDWQLKSGQTIALTRPAGLEGLRLVLAASGRAGLAAGKAALTSALGALKGAQRRARGGLLRWL